ncbi:flippase [Candidatus Saccharibacteria bacterium]|nr:flippase [Candidatus Saccharibacteria bacterium]
MKNKVIRNYMYTLAYQILIVILPIITMPYVSRALGAENIGVYGFTVSVVTYFTLLCGFGITKYGQREIAYVQSDRKKRSEIFWELCLIKLIAVLLFSIVFIIFFCTDKDYGLYYKILLLEIVAVFFDITWFFQGLEDFKKVVVRNIIVKIVSIAAIFIFVKSESDLLVYFWIYVISTLAGNVSLWVKLSKYVDKPNFKIVKLKRHVKPMFSLFIPQIAVSIYTVLDKTMLGWLTNDMSEVGYYEQSQKIIKLALTLVTTMSVVMMPRISNIFFNKDQKQMNKYMNMSFRFDWFMGSAVLFGVAAIAPTFVPWFFGDGYEKVISLLVYTSPVILIIALSSTIGSQYLVSVKKQNVQTLAVVMGAAINVGLNFILIPHLDSIGAVIATVIAETVITLVEIVYICRHNMIKLGNIFKGWFGYIISGVAMFGIIRLLQNVMGVGMLATFVQIASGGIVYCAILSLVHDDFIYYVLRMGVKIIKRRKV